MTHELSGAEAESRPRWRLGNRAESAHGAMLYHATTAEEGCYVMRAGGEMVVPKRGRVRRQKVRE